METIGKRLIKSKMAGGQIDFSDEIVVEQLKEKAKLIHQIHAGSPRPPSKKTRLLVLDHTRP